ncbi:hypothetical protein K504DRAFT_421242 [Pleomassaria siparia CBS 279.74]|uniref:Nucleotide-diphospho-sugar transferase domain-containing protein n=1 Tax=Pleomassaria siparia CBS 279.74 TaxID=1314801 RepID=A0A6G1KRJ5_9PLEO|nr:hypothetical protein K504DRAFT_421242 [Pleomassaria siparia CBS 279.74]
MPILFSQRILVLCIPTALLLLFAFSALRAGSVSAPIKSLKDTAQSAGHSINENLCTDERPDFAQKTFANTVAALYKPIKLPVTAKTYTDQQGNRFDNGGNNWWQASLGSDILIVDIDTRNPNGTREMFNSQQKVNWYELQPHGGGMLSSSFVNHFLYAQIHGYDYKFYNAPEIDGHYSTWIKPRALNEMLHSYRFVVFIDADAILQHLEVPMEFLFNRWGISPNTSIGMPIDTRQEIFGPKTSMDSKGKVVLNTGVVIAQAMPHTFEMMNAWQTCTNESRYPGCGQWKLKWSHEQRAFSEYIRYDFNPDGNNIVEISCDDANGYPGLYGQATVIDNCRGQFVRHHTIDKSMAKDNVADVMMQSVSEILQKTFLKHEEQYFIKGATSN